VVDPPAQAKLSREEVFGPVTCVYRFTKLDEAIEVANSLPFAFQASIFTREIGPALRAAERLDASAVMVNDHTAFRTDWRIFPPWYATACATTRGTCSNASTPSPPP
jgi:acyl-CoA reductase-like NAD-dependent aldehyde dehydrogenase